jgi:hypothetical protein
MRNILRALAWLIAGLCAYPALAKEKLTVLTAYHEDVVSRYETAFEQTYPDIDLVVIWKMPHDALPYLSQPQQSGVDVYWSASQHNFIALNSKGLGKSSASTVADWPISSAPCRWSIATAIFASPKWPAMALR